MIPYICVFGQSFSEVTFETTEELKVKSYGHGSKSNHGSAGIWTHELLIKSLKHRAINSLN